RSDLFVLGRRGRVERVVPLGYVPELHVDPTAGELVVVETELGPPTRYWLRGFVTDTWTERWRVEVGERPMYAGYPGRSTRVAADPHGSFLYTLQTRLLRQPPSEDVFRVWVVRYDRRTRTLETGKPVIDSCTVDFGCLDAAGGLFFHLSCDFP